MGKNKRRQTKGKNEQHGFIPRKSIIDAVFAVGLLGVPL